MNLDYLKERYEIIEVVGEGGEGRILKAFDNAVERYVAIKELKLESKDRNQALKEARAIARISHPNVVSLFDVVEDREKIYLIMEYVEGKSLREMLQEYSYLDFQVALGIFIQVALAVEFAHNHGILHLDIKPENILISKDGIVKLTDFGIARFLTEPEETGKIMGSTHYLAPESLKGRYSISSDVFGLGVILYEMLAGYNPFYSYDQEEAYKKILEYNPPEISSIRKDIPPEFDFILAKALAKQPFNRFKDVTRFRIKVERFFEYDYPEEPVRKLMQLEAKKSEKALRQKVNVLKKFSTKFSQAIALALASFAIAYPFSDGNIYTSLLFTSVSFLVSTVAIPLGAFLPFGYASVLFSKSSIAFSFLFVVLGVVVFFTLRDISKEGSLAGFAAAGTFSGLESALLPLFLLRKKARSVLSAAVFYASSAFLISVAAEFNRNSVRFIDILDLFEGRYGYIRYFLELSVAPLLALLLAKVLYVVFKESFRYIALPASVFAVGIIYLGIMNFVQLNGVMLIKRISISFLFSAILMLSTFLYRKTEERNKL